MGFSEVYDYVPGKAAWLAMGLPFEGENGPEQRAGAVVERGVPTCGLDETVGSVHRRSGEAEVCVVVEAGLVMGLLDGAAMDDPTRTAAAAMAPGPSTFRPSIPRVELAEYLDDHELDRALLTTLDGRLVGVVRRPAL